MYMVLLAKKPVISTISIYCFQMELWFPICWLLRQIGVQQVQMAAMIC